MKNRNVIGLLTLCMGLASSSKHVAMQKPAQEEFAQFGELPVELQVAVLQALETSVSIPEAIDAIKNLRTVSQTFKAIIDDPVTGKSIMNSIASRIPADDAGIRKAFNLNPNAYVSRNKFLVIAALKLGNAGALEWLKDRAQKDATIKQEINQRLHYAAMEGFLDTVGMLMRAGADLNYAVNNDTALIFAVKQEHPDVALALLEAGADAKLKDRVGKTALNYAEGRRMQAVREKLMQAMGK